MALVRITCPHCGLTKDVPEERIPEGSVRITCPQCREQFEFRKPASAATGAALSPPEAAQPPVASAGAGRTPEKSAASPTADGAAMVRLACPGCGFSKELPAGTISEGARVTCPKCGHSFVYLSDRDLSGAGTEMARPAAGSQAVKPPHLTPPAPRKAPRKLELTGIGELFATSWSIYKRRVVTLIGLILVVFLPFVLLAGALLFIHSIYPDLRMALPLVAGVVLAGIAAICIVSFWSGAALVFAVADESLSFREALDRSWPRIGSFLWLSMLLGFIVQGGFLLLVIPGLVFMVWFFFGQFIFADDDERGMNALLKSKEYIKGHFLDVFLRFFILMLIAGSISAIPFVGPLFLLLFWPFALIFIFLVYRDLREIKGDISYPCSAGEKCKWLGAGLLGYAIVPIILFAFLGTALLAMFSFVKSLDNYGMAVVTAPPGKPPEMPPLLKMATEGTNVVPVSMTAAQYDALLASQKVDFEDGTKLSVGPAAVQLGNFWDRQKSPSVWLKVRVASLPNLELNSAKFARLVVEHVKDRNNRDIYDPANDFEKDFFQRLNLSRHDASLPYTEAIRDVHLLAGTRESDIAEIDGTLVFTLPERIETLALDESMKGREVAGAGATVTLKEMSGEKVSLEYRGDFARHIKTVGYDKAGKTLPGQGSYSNAQGDVTTFNPQFNGEVHSVKVIVATDFVERKYPFALKR